MGWWYIGDRELLGGAQLFPKGGRLPLSFGLWLSSGGHRYCCSLGNSGCYSSSSQDMLSPLKVPLLFWKCWQCIYILVAVDEGWPYILWWTWLNFWTICLMHFCMLKQMRILQNRSSIQFKYKTWDFKETSHMSELHHQAARNIHSLW
jgi:hypothetical protein